MKKVWKNSRFRPGARTQETVPSYTRQLHRVKAEGLPGACLGCRFERGCRENGCAVLRRVSRIVAVIPGKTSDVLKN